MLFFSIFFVYIILRLHRPTVLTFCILVRVSLQDIRNTVGNIPMEWYKDFPHIGYNLDGKKIYKPIRNKDELDDFLDKMENPDYW